MKIRVNGRTIPYIFLILCVLLLVSACVWLNERGIFATPLPTQVAGPGVDPIFKEFYATLGGPLVLGKPLTALFERDGQRCQYTEAVLMCFDPGQADTSRRFFLAPLGGQLNVREDLPLASAESGKRDLGGGFVLYDEFAGLYDSLYGAIYAGRPLTQVRVDQASQRYEQFFENVGFYRRFDEPPGQAHLLPYGAYLCGPDCSQQLDDYWLIQQAGMISQPFDLSVQRLGLSDIGQPLAQPLETSDGFVEQAYDNVVLFAPKADLSQVNFRPLVRLLKFVPEEPLVQKNPQDQLVFYEVQDGLGHNVPVFFDHFIANHGGRDLSGDPLTEIFVIEKDRVFRQCFENYCLDYNALAPAQTRVRMVPLGLEYLRANEPNQTLRQAFSTETVALNMSEAFPQLGKGQTQRVNMHVFGRADGHPMYLVEGTLTLTYPGRPSDTLHFRPTGKDGSSQLDFAVPVDLPNMTVVEYRACLNLPSDPRICSTESFIYTGR